MRFLIAALLLAVATPCAAAPVELPVTVGDGATWTIATVRTRTTDTDGKALEARSESRSRAVYRVDGDAGRLTLEPLEGFASADLPPQLAEAGLSFPLEFEVDDALTPTRLRNWPQLRDTLLRWFDSQPGDKAARDAVAQLYRGISDETAPGIFTPHLSLVALGQGTGLEVGETRSYDDEIPNPLGGPPIGAKGALSLVSHDARAGRAVVVWKQTLDPASMAAGLREAAKGLVDRLGGQATPDEIFKSMKFDRADSCRYEIDTATGLAARVECESAVTIAAQGRRTTRTDTWTITQTLPETR